MRELVPEPGSAPADVHACYARDWVETGGLRVNFVSSADGAATVSGQSRGLQTAGDNTVFGALRDLADVILVGAGTARDEGYRPSRPSAARRAIRQDRGLPPVPRIALVSYRLDLDPAWELFTATEPDARTIVITHGAADPARLAALREVAEVIVAGADAVDLTEAVSALRPRGLTRILCEGGPSLFGDLAAAGLVDELCLSVTPLLAGPGSRRIVDGPPWSDGPRALRLSGLLEEDGALFARYRAVPR